MAGSILEHHEVRAVLALLGAWIEGQMAHRGLPGLALGVVHDQDLVWARGFGWADVDRQVPATPDTLFRIASITKLFTATAILHLRDAGRLGLDDPIVTHLPWFSMKTPDPEAVPLTIRHLLTHTAGLPREAPFPYWTDLDFPAIGDLRAALDGQETVLPVETRWKYSNLAMVLAGEIVATASGEAYPDYLRRHILEPLGMTATYVATPPVTPRLATGYERRLPGRHRGPAPFSDLRGLTAAASMTTSVRDLARFAMLQFRDGPAGGAQVLRGRTLREMHRVHWLEPDWEAGWGLGFRVLRRGGRTHVGHAGSLRGYRTEMRLCPEQRLGVIVLTNADDGEPATYVDRAFEWLSPAVGAVTPAPAPTPPDPGWQRYAGRYRNAWADVEVLVLGGELVMIGPALPDPTVSSGRLEPAGEHTFRVDTREGFGIHGELVVFELDAAGKVARVKVGQNYTVPVEAW
jgi:CubicO group peptidase (beta-lactamase class C family)